MKVRSVTSSRLAKAVNSSRMAVEDLLVVVDQVHLVDAHQEVGHPQERCQEGVAAGLLDDALAGVDQDHGQVGGRVPGDHVAGVLHVPRGVGDDELPGRRGEVAVGHVDGDALLPLGPQAVGQQGEVGVVVAALGLHPLDRLELVLEDGLRVVEQAPDERALAVVDRAGGGEAEEFHQKYPSRLRSSMAASLTRSSARVAPRSVSRRRGHLDDDVVDRRRRSTRPRRCRSCRPPSGSGRWPRTAPRRPDGSRSGPIDRSMPSRRKTSRRWE